MTTRIGIVGTGGIARAHANALVRVPDVEIGGVYDVDDARAKEFAAAYGTTALPSDEAVIEGADAVYVCTWTAAHQSVVEHAAAAGRPVFCEKPLAPNLAAARAMGEAVTKAGVVNQVGLPLRWRPEFLLLRQLLADPANGQILTATLHSEIPTRAAVRSSWRGDPVLAGGGMLIEVGFHDLDLLQWLVAPIRGMGAQTVAAGPSAPAGDPSQPNPIEDGAALALSFTGGAIGSLVAVWHDVVGRKQTRGLQVVCEYAHYSLELGGPVRRLVATGPGDRNLVVDGERFDAMVAELGHPTDPDGAFVRAVQRGEPAVPTRPTITDAVDVHLLIDAAYRAAATGTAWSRELDTDKGNR